jgi:LuxR family transcriptional regulator
VVFGLNLTRIKSALQSLALSIIQAEDSMKTWQENQLQVLHSSQSEHELFQTILSLAKELDFDTCSYGLRMPFPVTNPKIYLVDNYPEDWQKQYKTKNYLATDPTVQLGMRSLLPIIWTEDLFIAARDLWEEARSFGLCIGWAQSIRDFNGVASMLTLARSNDPITEAELNNKRFKISWLTQIAHSGMSEYLIPKIMPEASVKLSNREIEVLRWTADGKTSGEISCILNVAERTVNFHINNIIAKLGASNKTSAAIKAALLGLL